MNEISQLTQKLITFRDARNWEQFHNPKDLAIALSIEASELLEAFLWKHPDQASIEKIKEELADVFAYALLLAFECKLDITEILSTKLEANELKYPIDKARGNAKKYSEL